MTGATSPASDHRHDASLRSPGCCPRLMQMDTHASAPGEDKILQGGQAHVVLVYPRLESVDVVVVERDAGFFPVGGGVEGGGDGAPNVEESRLDLYEALGEEGEIGGARGVVALEGEDVGDADGDAELVDVAERLEDGVVLVAALHVEQARRARVARARVHLEGVRGGVAAARGLGAVALHRHRRRGPSRERTECRFDRPDASGRSRARGSARRAVARRGAEAPWTRRLSGNGRQVTTWLFGPTRVEVSFAENSDRRARRHRGIPQRADVVRPPNRQRKDGSLHAHRPRGALLPRADRHRVLPRARRRALSRVPPGDGRLQEEGRPSHHHPRVHRAEGLRRARHVPLHVPEGARRVRRTRSVVARVVPRRSRRG